MCTVRKGNSTMAKTKSSVRGTQNKKIVPVKPYKKSDGTKVKAHRRSTPN
jgi:hypothetical protein